MKAGSKTGARGFSARNTSAGGSTIPSSPSCACPGAKRWNSAAGSRHAPASPSACRPKPNGNTPAAPGPPPPFSYGGPDTDFSPYANLADATIRELAYDNWSPRPPDLVPRDARFNDGALVTADTGRYAPNAWGLHDMHGNAWEWTRSAYAPYPWKDDERNSTVETGRKVARGGSWYDRPARAKSSFRIDYPAWQRVSSVGFRVVVADLPPAATVQAPLPAPVRKLAGRGS